VWSAYAPCDDECICSSWVKARAQLDELMDDFVAARSNVTGHLYDDVLPALRALRAAGVCVGAVTDGNTDVSRAAAVGELFDFAVTAADAGSSKSAVPPYLQAAHASGHRPTSIVHVGDSISKDLCGALLCSHAGACA